MSQSITSFSVLSTNTAISDKSLYAFNKFTKIITGIAAKTKKADVMTNKRFVLVPIYLFHHEGSRLIISYLRERGLDARSVYFCDMWKDPTPSEESYNALFDKLMELKPDVVGLSFFCIHRDVARRIGDFCRKRLKALVVGGGVQSTIEPEDTLDFADLVIRGDGEVPLETLLKGYNGDKRIFRKIPGAVYRDKNNRIKTGLPNIYLDLVTLPFSDMDQDAFFVSKGRVTYGYDLNSITEIEISGSRGCPFSCTYCSNSYLNELPNRPRVRVKSAEYLLKEIERAKKLCKNLSRIVFGDEMFLAKREVINKFLDEYPKRIGLPFSCLFHPNTIDEDLMKKMVDAGMKMGRCGIQAMSQKTRREIYNRNTRDEDIMRIARMFKKYKNVRLAFDLIVNNPLESEEDIIDGFNFMLSLPTVYELNVHVLFHLPKTKLTTRFLEEGLIEQQHIEGYNQNPNRWGIDVLDPNPKVDFTYGLDRFWLYMATLISKGFIPRWFLRTLSKSRFLRKHTRPLYYFAWSVNVINLGLVSLNMIRNKEIKLSTALNVFLGSRLSILKTNK